MLGEIYSGEKGSRQTMAGEIPLALFSPTSGRTTHAQLEHEEAFKGGMREKYRLLIALTLEGTARSRQFQLIKRKNSSTSESRDYVFNWKKLRAAGLPVVPFVRVDGRYNYTPDLTQFGARVYGRGVAEYFAHEENREGDEQYLHLFYQPSELDQHFVSLMQTSFSEIKTQAELLSEKAASQGIVLPEDPFVLLIQPDKSWSLLLLDVEKAEYDVPVAEARVTNLARTKVFLRLLTEVATEFTKK